ncbi:hypothetical protein TWF696_003397 [Orbilia brochopaga]|uniref:Peptidase S8/S53 domain-containing protein n=1 Tax=Orbilia brochopaga TaxID=3140254 RepID=A0AAV9U0N1_9PEZI
MQTPVPVRTRVNAGGTLSCPKTRSCAEPPVGVLPVVGSMHDAKDTSAEIDHFSAFLEFIRPKAPTLFDFDPNTQSPTQVLLLDSGINVDHELLRIFAQEGQIKPWRTFGMADTDSLKDMNGHGTACAYLIASITQGAVVYSGRVCEGGKDGRPLARNVAQAILAAVSEQDGVKFDLIVIPIGFPEDDPELSKAIQVGLNKRILIVAAAGNEGDSSSTYPADYDGVIAACSSDYWGNKSKFSASMNDKNNAPLYILGENLMLPWASKSVEETPASAAQSLMKLKSGTSYSAAILAGICASLLQLASARPEDADMLHGYGKMHRLLTKMRRSNVFNAEEFKEEFLSHGGLMSP